MNKHANYTDRDTTEYQLLFNELADIYDACGRIPESAETAPGAGLFDYTTRIQWSREWEYPWCLLVSRPKPGMNIVDLGCGASPLPIFLAKKGCNVVGIDNNSFDGGKAHSEVRLWGLHPEMSDEVTYLDEDMTKTSLDDRWADIIYCVGVIEHMRPDEVDVLKEEVCRILADDGLVVITMDFHKGKEITCDMLEWPGFELVGDTELAAPDDMLTMRNVKVFGWVMTKRKDII